MLQHYQASVFTVKTRDLIPTLAVTGMPRKQLSFESQNSWFNPKFSKLNFLFNF